MTAETEFGLLGPMVVRRGREPVPVPAGKQRVVLAALLLGHGRTVSLDELTELLWVDEAGPPASARVTIQNYVKRLRHLLGDARHEQIATRPDGYLLTAGTGRFDVSRFESLAARAAASARAGTWDAVAGETSAALSLWRGRPLVDVPSEALSLREVPGLTELHLQVLETRIDADLHIGRHREVIAELVRLAEDEPLRERLHELLMLALYRDGRQADALAAYRRARRLLNRELGIEPGPELRHLHERILAADPALAAARTGQSAGTGRDQPVPRQLPATIPQFTGRRAELSALSGLLGTAREERRTVVISVIGGAAGVGKTTLAVCWAHEVSSRYPDGQLYVNMGGFGPSAPVTPAEALRRFLGALGVAPDQVPSDLEALAALYRSALAGRRMLVLLDNARDAEQVRPLLPGGEECLVIVTSRSQLAGLVTAEGAFPLTVDVLTEPDARELIARRLGAARAAAEPAVLAELARQCARLPLALAVVGARAALSPALPLSALARDLRDAATRLDALSGGDMTSSVRVVFSWSYRGLSEPAARMFRLLGIHSGPDCTAPAAASLAGISRPAAQEALRELTGAHLLTEHLPGRYTCHDLLRVYAAEQAARSGDEEVRTEALGRSLDHYLHSAHAAAGQINPFRQAVPLAPARSGVSPEGFAGPGEALAWMEAEHRVLLAAISQAAEAGFDVHAWQIPAALTNFLDWHGHWHDWTATQRQAVAAAERLADRAGQAHARHSLGYAYARLGDYPQAEHHLWPALRLYEELCDLVGQARVHHIFTMALGQQERHDEALGHATRALGLYQAAGHKPGEAGARNAVGWCHAHRGEYQQALSSCEVALGLHRELGNLHGQGTAWKSLGYARHHLGQPGQAIPCYQRGLALFQELGDRDAQAEILGYLGDAQDAAGNREAAERAWQEALSIRAALRHGHAGEVRA